MPSSSSSTTPPPPTTTSAAAPTISARHVLRFIPNLIGYFRVICTLISLTMMIILIIATPHNNDSSTASTTLQHHHHHVMVVYHSLAIGLYVASFVADMVDGWAARKFQQSSQFGGMLDMITDRCSTLGLLYVLGTSSSKSAWISLTFLFLMILDISSHWCQMYSTCLISQGSHHKSRASNSGRNILVQWYYHYYWFFGYLCVGAEFTYIFTYLLRHVVVVVDDVVAKESRDAWSWALLRYNLVLVAWYACVPGCIMKQIVNVAQLSSACHALARFDALQIQRERELKQKHT